MQESLRARASARSHVGTSRSRVAERPQDDTPVAPKVRAPYAPPRLERFGTLALLTSTVSMTGLMDGWMGRRTG